MYYLADRFKDLVISEKGSVWQQEILMEDIRKFFQTYGAYIPKFIKVPWSIYYKHYIENPKGSGERIITFEETFQFMKIISPEGCMFGSHANNDRGMGFFFCNRDVDNNYYWELNKKDYLTIRFKENILERSILK